MANESTATIEVDELLVTHSTAMRALVEHLVRIAAGDDPALIVGEPGTGKERVARAIHHRSNRSDAAFLRIDCGELIGGHLDEELFGRRAPDGSASMPGLLELANRGTVLLTAVDQLPHTCQHKLLEFLQTNSINGRLVDVRVLTTVSQVGNAGPIDGLITALLERLSAHRLHVPPLRERREDLAPLTDRLLKDIAIRHRSTQRRLTSSALQRLLEHDWPDNVRELNHCLREIAANSDNDLIDAGDLVVSTGTLGLGPQSLKAARRAAECEVVIRALRHYTNNVTRASRALGVSRMTFYRLMARCGIHPQQNQQP